MNRLFPLALAALCPTAPASAQITAFQHIILVVQENRTPDNLFQGLCTTRSACSTRPSQGQYDIQTTGWFDKTAPGGRTNPHAIPLGVGYDISHRHSAWVLMCDRNSSGVCKMDGAAREACVHGTCPPKAAFGYVDNSSGAVQPYIDIAHDYGWGNYMFQTNQGPSYPAHQFLFGATSAPLAADDHAGNFVAENSPPETGCTAPATTTAPVIDAQGIENDPVGRYPNGVYPCFERQTLSDLLNSAGVPWRYYGASVTGSTETKRTGIWVAPNSIRHICVPSGGQCTGSGWSNVVFTPSQVLTDIGNCQLSGVSWVMPDALDSDHATSPNNVNGPSWIASIVNAVGQSKCTNSDGSSYWNSTAIIVTWDDWGGWYDHEPPRIEASPQGGYQMGFRVPLIVVSAYTPPGFISNSRQDFGSVIRFVEQNFGIMEGALTFADARGGVSDFKEFFSLGNAPRPFQTIKAPLSAKYFSTRKPSGLSVDDDD